jgi:hypothetical protein
VNFPIPILVLLAIVALFVYTVIGAVTASLICRDKGDTQKRAARKTNGDGSEWVTFWWFTALWPVAIAVGGALCIAVGLVIGILYGPFWIARGIGRYAAGIKVEKPEVVVMEGTATMEDRVFHA